MATKLDDLIIGLQLRTKALESGLNEAKRKLNKHSNDIRTTGRGYDELAIVAGVAFAKIVSSINAGVQAFNTYNNAMVGLKSVAEGTGNSFGEAQRFLESYIEDGLVPAGNAATALKNLMARGFSMGEAADIMNRFKDSAAFGRQAALSLGDAVQSATEGLKNENSVLVDNAGVTKNVSIMWKEYAQTIGKSVDNLTAAEKRMAEYNGIMKETRFQVGDAAKYAQEFAGAQAKAAAETTKLNLAIGSSMVPSLTLLLNLFTPLLGVMSSFIETNPVLASSVIAMGASMASMATGALAVTAAFKVLKPAIAAVTGMISANPVILGIAVALTAIVGAITAITAAVQKAKKAQDAYNTSLKEFNDVARNGIQAGDIGKFQEQANTLDGLIQQYDALMASYHRLSEAAGGMGAPLTLLDRAEKDTGISAKELSEAFYELGFDIDMLTGNADEARKRLDMLKNAIREANRVTLDEYAAQAKAVAQRRTTIIETQNLIAAYESATQGSTEWYAAQKKLSDQFPEFSSNSGIAIDAIKKTVEIQDAAVKAEWKLLQAKISMSRRELQTILAVEEAKLTQAEIGNLLLRQQAGDIAMNSRLISRNTADLMAQIEKVKQLRADIEGMLNYEQIDIDKIMGVTVPESGGGKAFTVYENKALDSALRIMEHKKRMNQLTVEDEIRTLETILRKNVRTSDERMDIEERLFDARQALRDREQEAIDAQLESNEKKLARRTSFSLQWIENQQAYDPEFGTDDQTAAYNRIIRYHKEYLESIIADTKISADEKERIIQEETDFIGEQQRRIYGIQKAALDKSISEYIEAKRTQYDREEQLENDRLNAKLDALDKEYRDKERALTAADREQDLSSLYEQERRWQNAATKEGQDKLADIRQQIRELNADAEKDRLAEERDEKRAAIEDEITKNREKYQTMKDDLASAQTEMLAAATAFSKTSTTILSDSTVGFGDSLQSLFSEFDSNQQKMMDEGLKKLRRFVDDYNGLMSGLAMKPALSIGSTGTAALAVSGGTSVTINDYGDKIMTNKEDVADYGTELMKSADAAARVMGRVVKQ